MDLLGTTLHFHDFLKYSIFLVKPGAIRVGIFEGAEFG